MDSFPISGPLFKLKHAPPLLGSAWNERYFTVEARRSRAGGAGLEYFFSYYPSQSKSNNLNSACDATPLHLLSYVGPCRLDLYSSLDERARLQLRTHAPFILEVETPHRPFFLRSTSTADVARWMAMLQRLAGLTVTPPWSTSSYGPEPPLPEPVVRARLELGTLPPDVRARLETPPAAPPGVTVAPNATPRRSSITGTTPRLEAGLKQAAAAASSSRTAAPAPVQVAPPVRVVATAAAASTPTAVVSTSTVKVVREVVIEEEEPEAPPPVLLPTRTPVLEPAPEVTRLEPQQAAASQSPQLKYSSVQEGIERAMAARRASQVKSSAAEFKLDEEGGETTTAVQVHSGIAAATSTRRSVTTPAPLAPPPAVVEVVKGVVGGDRDWNEWDDDSKVAPTPAPAPPASSRPPLPSGAAPGLPSGRTTLNRGTIAPRPAAAAAATVVRATGVPSTGGIVADRDFVHDDWDS